MDLTPFNKEYIDSLSVFSLLQNWRFAHSDNPWFQGETGQYWADRMAELRNKDNDAYVQASKDIGWR
jgi:hypothetical protein